LCVLGNSQRRENREHDDGDLHVGGVRIVEITSLNDDEIEDRGILGETSDTD
jgi:hypothetical protein